MPSDQVDAILTQPRSSREIIEELNKTDPELLVLPTPEQIESDVALIDAAYSKDRA